MGSYGSGFRVRGLELGFRVQGWAQEGHPGGCSGGLPLNPSSKHGAGL